MKILLAVHHFPPRYNAGAELYTFRLARWLLAHGHAAEVVCIETLDNDRNAGVVAEHEHYEGVPVWRLHLGLRGAPADWSYANPLVAAWVGDYLREQRPDLLHLHSGYLIGGGVIAAAQAQGIPSIITLHDYWFLCPRITLLRGDGKICNPIPADPAGCAWCLHLDQRRYRMSDQISGGAAGRAWIALASGSERDQQAARRAYLRQTLHTVDLALAPSRFLASCFSEVMPAERIRVLRIGVEQSHLRQVPPPNSATALRLAYIGQIAEHKGVHVLVEAVQRLAHTGRPVTLTIHGNLHSFPAYAQRLRQMIGTDERITLAGPFANGQIASVLAAADLVVVPSIWYENSPLTILEAQAAGRPVLASALGGMAELVRDGIDGLHFIPGDAADLARQIQRLRSEPGVLARLAAGIRPPLSIDEELSGLATIYAQVVARPQSAPFLEVA
jgi:glycosyltransferase involved in cell wall biosynthesis